jgi:hypothetical protein
MPSLLDHVRLNSDIAIVPHPISLINLIRSARSTRLGFGVDVLTQELYNNARIDDPCFKCINSVVQTKPCLWDSWPGLASSSWKQAHYSQSCICGREREGVCVSANLTHKTPEKVPSCSPPPEYYMVYCCFLLRSPI